MGVSGWISDILSKNILQNDRGISVLRLFPFSNAFMLWLNSQWIKLDGNPVRWLTV
jgi:hypothetical protein